jgi:phosphatidyl-myo-inositol alpha-mannosyltransferase
MRVALLCPYSLSRPGGVQGQVTGLARALGAHRHEVVVLAPFDGPGAASRRGARAGAPDTDARGSYGFVALGRSLSLPANGSVAPVSLSPMAAVRAVRSIREGGFDVVHLHEPFAPGAGYACLVACSEPTLGTFHRSGAGVPYRVLGIPGRLLADRLDWRCAVSPEAGATARSVLGGTYEIVGNGVEVDRFEGAPRWPTQGPTVLFLGRHERRKGLGVLLDAWERGSLSVRHPDSALWVAGDGPESEQLRRLHPPGSGVEWLGRIGDEERESRLAGAQVLCAPSLGGESFGMVIVEAMAARTAVVASDIPGYRFAAGSHARLVPPGDPTRLAQTLHEALGEAEASTGSCSPESLGRALAHARTWSMGALAARYASIYESLATRTR